MRIHRSISAGNKRALLLSLAATVVLSLLPISSHATVDWNDGFEYVNAAAMNAVWSSSNPGCADLQPSTTRFFSGASSLKETFSGDGNGNSTSTCFMDRNLNGSSATVYHRWMMYLDNFTVDNVSTKMVLDGNPNFYPSFWWGMIGGVKNVDVTLQEIATGDGSTFTTINLYGGTIPSNQWVCVETQVTSSSPGGADGLVNAWINGTLVMNVTGQGMLNGTVIGNHTNTPGTLFTFTRLYTQHGVGVIYYDDFAVSRDARIGCSGSVPTSVTPPAAPLGLTVR
jgi:hypothetical protein